MMLTMQKHTTLFRTAHGCTADSIRKNELLKLRKYSEYEFSGLLQRTFNALSTTNEANPSYWLAANKNQTLLS